MKNSQKELDLMQNQVARVERALDAIRQDILPMNEARFRLMAEGYIKQIQSLRIQIDRHLGIDTAEGDKG